MSPHRYRRTDRVATLLLQEVTRIIREEVRDPRIGFVTFTGADVSPDLAAGRLFVSVMGTEEEKHESLAGLRSAAAFIRNQLWDILDLKTIPELTFELDRTLERAARIDQILEQIGGEQPPGQGSGVDEVGERVVDEVSENDRQRASEKSPSRDEGEAEA
jgi:ribosome-binding factor A